MFSNVFIELMKSALNHIQRLLCVNHIWIFSRNVKRNTIYEIYKNEYEIHIK